MRDLPLLAAVSGFLLTGCVSRFERDWRARAEEPRAGRFDGKWDGRWVSAKHRNAGGRLRCLLAETGPNRFHAQFKAEWKVFSSGYGIDFTAHRHGAGISFRGEKNLGSIFGGVYSFEGKADQKRFSASYDSSYDHGTFEMHRVSGPVATSRP